MRHPASASPNGLQKCYGGVRSSARCRSWRFQSPEYDENRFINQFLVSGGLETCFDDTWEVFRAEMPFNFEDILCCISKSFFFEPRGFPLNNDRPGMKRFSFVHNQYLSRHSLGEISYRFITLCDTCVCSGRGSFEMTSIWLHRTEYDHLKTKPYLLLFSRNQKWFHSIRKTKTA
jgi:hypothetical protein